MGNNISDAKDILDLGVPGILLVMLLSLGYGFIYFFKHSSAKLDDRDEIIRNIQNEYIEKVQELMQKQIDSVTALVKTIEKNNSSNTIVSNKLEELYSIIKSLSDSNRSDSSQDSLDAKPD